ncbi:MAG: L,D-transpeptidase family protein [Daejeonella sp.]
MKKLFFLLLFALSFIEVKCQSNLNSDHPDTLLDFKKQLFDSLLCDGFDFPVGNAEGRGPYTSLNNSKVYPGFYIATYTGEKYALGIHTGEDWNGSGGGNTDEGLAVHATAKGIVIAAGLYPKPWGNIVMIEHQYIENGIAKKVFSLYAHLSKISVTKGDIVSKRKIIGTIGTGNSSFPAHLHFEIRKESMQNYAADYWPSSNNKDKDWVLNNYEQPSAFIRNHRNTLVPKNEGVIIVAVKHEYKMYVYNEGKEVKSYEIAISQDPNGHKTKEGDNKTPEGEYRIIEKSKGPFSGKYGAYLGVAWLRVSYPNNYDAISGYDAKKITKDQLNSIIKSNNAGLMPLKNTTLGGGIGVHGWAGDWSNSGNKDLTWGCISMHNADLKEFYDLIPLKTKILILK